MLPKKLSLFLYYFFREYKISMFIYVFLSFVAGFWGPFNSFLLKQLINLLPEAKMNGSEILLFPASLIVINFIIFDNFTWRGVDYIKYKVIPVVLNSIDKALLDYTLAHSHEFFTQNMTGTISKQIFHLIDGAEKIIGSSLPNILRMSSLLFAASFFAYCVNLVFFYVLILWSISFLGISFFMSKKLILLSQNQAEKESVLGGQIIDSLSNSFNVRLFAQVKEEVTRRAPALLNYVKSYQEKQIYILFMHSIQGALIAVMFAFSIFFLLSLYEKGLITVGDFALILGLSVETGHMMWFTMHEVDALNKEVGRCKQSLESLLVSREIQDKSNSKDLIVLNGKVTFNNVSFCYKDTKPLFDNINISIEPGQKVGLVGYSGSGKSTFVNLILRLYDVKEGAILIDGQDIKYVKQNTLRNNIAMIPQDPSLFHRSLMENIRYGDLGASDEEVILASKKAHAHEFISKLPHLYESLVGDKGVKLSGGQRQRIAIARAILKNSPILILDEATSQLDSVTESLIQESLWELMQNKTTIVVAHRLSTLLHMDRILVFDKGKIIEDGIHSELLAKDGLYKHLWDAQVGGFLGDEKTDETFNKY